MSTEDPLDSDSDSGLPPPKEPILVPRFSPTAAQFVGPFRRAKDGSLPPVSGGMGRLNIKQDMPYQFQRRESVSAESITPSDRPEDYAKLPKYPKTEAQTQRIKSSVKDNFLFNNLDPKQESIILAAFREKHVVAGEKVIKQGDLGDDFYIVETGKLEIYVGPEQSPYANRPTPGPAPGDIMHPDGLGKLVQTCTAGSSFGELALMYNAKRAATVIAIDDSVLWALDRITFRTILLNTTFRKRKMHEEFLASVPLLSKLTRYERCKIADSLETTVHKPGDVVVKQGDPGDRFYLVESGFATVSKASEGPNGEKTEVVVAQLKMGEYFGELALLHGQPRAATVRANITVPDGSKPAPDLRLVSMHKDAFERLMGPARAIMQRRAVKYNESGETPAPAAAPE